MQRNCNIAVIVQRMTDDVKTPAGADRQAARIGRTEALLVSAARAAFLEHGYVATTLAEIAERAGVSPRTVYVRFGTKAALFRRVVDEALTGDADPVDVEHRPRTQDALGAPTLAERIAALVDVCTGIAHRAGALFDVANQAEGVEPEIAAAAQAGRTATAELCATFWSRAADDGLLPAGADVRQLAITTDVLLCADTVVHLRRTHRWSTQTHGAWLSAALAGLLAPSA